MEDGGVSVDKFVAGLIISCSSRHISSVIGKLVASYNGSLTHTPGIMHSCCMLTTARVLASQAEAIVRTGKHGHNIE